MQGIERMAINDLFRFINSKENSQKLSVNISFVEIFGEKILDLLNDKAVVKTMEDKSGQVQFQGLVEHQARSTDELMKLMEIGFGLRTTMSTVNNDESSRSHAICQISLKNSEGTRFGRLILVDLAGNERAADTQKNDKNRQAEGAMINTSLLALKECIRAMDELRKGANTHVPFRQSKLTLALRDSFVESKPSTASKLIMIGCVTPGNSYTDYSLNTLWYASKLGGNRKQVNTKYNNAAFNATNGSLNSSQLLKQRSQMNSSFEGLDKPLGHGQSEPQKRPSVDTDSLVFARQMSIKESPTEKQVPLQWKSGRAGNSVSKALPLNASSAARASVHSGQGKRDTDRDEPKKNNFIRQLELSSKAQDELNPLDTSSKENLLAKYVQALKGESDLVRKESHLLAELSEEPSSGLGPHRKTLLGHIKQKLALLNELQSLLQDDYRD